MAKEYNIKIERTESGPNEILYTTLDEFEAIWNMLTKGFYIQSPDGKTWIPPQEVSILPDGNFLFKPRGGGRS